MGDALARGSMPTCGTIRCSRATIPRECDIHVFLRTAPQWICSPGFFLTQREGGEAVAGRREPCKMKATMARRRLPIGIQTFRKLRERNCYYVDKTPFALQPVDEGTHYFLSRPRRFGKSLFLDTLTELFEGSRELFEGLTAHGGWDWSAPPRDAAGIREGKLRLAGLPADEPSGAAGGAGGGRGD